MIELKAELNSPERKKLFNPRFALKSLGVTSGMYVADVGCGTGFFTFPLSRIVGEEGKVFAIDISPHMLKDVRRLIQKEKLKNVRVILSKENKIPLESKKVDFCLLASVVHELENPKLFFKELKRILKNNGKLGIIEWKKIPSPLGPPLKERISLLEMEKIIKQNKLKIEKIIGLGKYNYGLVASFPNQFLK
ncbi:MAG: class I SAM-dependent methyltransferase [Candidatus Omnitrophica bacterium]|nr:class I SAM-dependent methyltransferase [Candidatus Omnitrophota bacterium]